MPTPAAAGSRCRSLQHCAAERSRFAMSRHFNSRAGRCSCWQGMPICRWPPRRRPARAGRSMLRSSAPASRRMAAPGRWPTRPRWLRHRRSALGSSGRRQHARLEARLPDLLRHRRPRADGRAARSRRRLLRHRQPADRRPLGAGRKRAVFLHCHCPPNPTPHPPPHPLKLDRGPRVPGVEGNTCSRWCSSSTSPRAERRQAGGAAALAAAVLTLDRIRAADSCGLVRYRHVDASAVQRPVDHLAAPACRRGTRTSRARSSSRTRPPPPAAPGSAASAATCTATRRRPTPTATARAGGDGAPGRQRHRAQALLHGPHLARGGAGDARRADRADGRRLGQRGLFMFVADAPRSLSAGTLYVRSGADLGQGARRGPPVVDPLARRAVPRSRR